MSHGWGTYPHPAQASQCGVFRGPGRARDAARCRDHRRDLAAAPQAQEGAQHADAECVDRALRPVLASVDHDPLPDVGAAVDHVPQLAGREVGDADQREHRRVRGAAALDLADHRVVAPMAALEVEAGLHAGGVGAVQADGAEAFHPFRIELEHGAVVGPARLVQQRHELRVEPVGAQRVHHRDRARAVAAVPGIGEPHCYVSHPFGLPSLAASWPASRALLVAEPARL